MSFWTIYFGLKGGGATPTLPTFDRPADVFATPEWRWVYPTTMAAPEIAAFLRDTTPDTEDCFGRRPDLDHSCLRRNGPEITALRRAPECPQEFACPNEGCT